MSSCLSAKALELGVVSEPEYSVALACLAYIQAREALGMAALPTEAFRFPRSEEKQTVHRTSTETGSAEEQIPQFVGTPKQNWDSADFPLLLQGLCLRDQVRSPF